MRGSGKYFAGCCIGVAAWFGGVAFAANDVLRVRLVDEATGGAVPGAVVVLGERARLSSPVGRVRFRDVDDDRVTLTAIYKAGSVRRMVTFHDVPTADDGAVVLPLPNALPLQREARFSLSVPFVPEGTDWVGLLPQLAVDIAGPKLGIFDGIELFENKLQDDGLASFMVVAFDDDGLPFQYGHFLDQAPGAMDGAFLFLGPPMASSIVNAVDAVGWSKAADAINPSNPPDNCDFTVPPYTTCGVVDSVNGVFSWLNVKRKGVTYSTPGAFLPARTSGANPLLALPDSAIELVGHDDPLGGFNGTNFSRFQYLRFDTAPAETVIQMPNVLIGAADESGAEAIELDDTGDGLAIRWMLGAAGDDLSDAQAADYATVDLMWQAMEDGGHTIWRHWFAPAVGQNVLVLPTLPGKLEHLTPVDAEVFSDVTVTVYGSVAVDGFDGAWAAWQAGDDPLQLGDEAFNVVRWR